MEGLSFRASQDSLSALSGSSAQNSQSGTPPSKLKNSLLLLRSPGPEDVKKKKGRSSSTKSRKSVSSSQERQTLLSFTPVKAESEEQTCRGEDSISYSPLSEFPVEEDVRNNECGKILFNEEATGSEAEDSVELFSDNFSSEDELLVEFIDNLETNNVQLNKHASPKTQLESVSSLPPTNQLSATSVAESSASSSVEKEAYSTSIHQCKSSAQSPQSIVLERLRETLRSSDSLKSSLHSEQPHTSSPQVCSSQRSQSMPPQKSQSRVGQASCLKQMDIGVFFGLKPLKKIEKKTECRPNELSTSFTPTLGENSGRQRRPRKERQRRSRANTTADTSQGIVESNVVDVQREAGRNGSRGWRGRRWNRVNSDGEVQLPRCPFYKKIPGQGMIIVENQMLFLCFVI